jgi:hypothetical protein
MNPKIANLIAIETGILIGLMSWLVYSRLPSAEPRTAPSVQEEKGDPFATVAPVINPRDQNAYAVDYAVERERAQIAHEAQVAREQQYYQEIAPKPYANARLGNASIAMDSPSYANVDQEPAVVPSENVEPPQTVVYTQPIQTFVYAQPPPIVVFSNPRRFANRCQSTPHFSTPSTITQQCPDRRNSRLNDARVVPSPKVSTPSFRPTQGVRPRGTVRQTGVTGIQQKRVAFPASPGAERRFVP